MKYFPLVWAALWRKPVRAVLTLLSVAIAFMLFGLMIGLNASINHVVDLARKDQIFVSSRYGGAMPSAFQDQIARLPGVTHVAKINGLSGYYQTLRNPVTVTMGDDQLLYTWSELPLTPQQMAQLKATPDGIFMSRSIAQRLKQKAGDKFPVTVPQIARQDGGHVWILDILAVTDDIDTAPGGYIVGNFDYFDLSRLDTERGRVATYRVAIRDPDQGSAIAKRIDKMFANSSVSTRSITEKAVFENATSGAGLNFSFVTQAIAGAGIFMILFLTGNSIAQSVRERIPEFAVLKTVGFSDKGVVALVFAEAALPCLLGAAIGMALAAWIAANVQRLMPAGVNLPPPNLTLPVLGLALLTAMLVALVSAVLPGLRISRLDVATALSGR